MIQGLGIAKRRLVEKIILENWQLKNPEQKHYSFHELLYVIQELLIEEGKPYLLGNLSPMFGHQIFRDFAQHLLYRNLANYDSMVLMTSEKGCITGDALLEMPRDLKKYPKGIPIKELVGKGPQWVYSFNINTQKLELKKCDGVEYVKTDDVWEVELTNGQKIKATEDHPFLLTNGEYKQLKDLVWIDKVDGKDNHRHARWMEKGKLKYTDRLRVIFRPDKLSKDNFIKFDYTNIDKKNNDTSYKHTIQEHRFIAQTFFNDINNKSVHHKNSKWWDNNIDNLSVMTQQEHFYLHNMKKYAFKKNNKFGELGVGYTTKKKEKIISGSDKFCQLMSQKRAEWFFKNKNSKTFINFCKKRKDINPIRSKCQTGGIIKCIKYIGKKDVFDVVNVQDNHNFIVNGFVVSNTGKSSAAMMLCREWCRLLGIRFNPQRHIAYNNGDVRTKIEVLNKFEPILCVEGNTHIYVRINGKEDKKRICELDGKKNIEVLSFNVFLHELEWCIASKIKKTGIKKTIDIYLKNGQSIGVTPEHLILTGDDNYKQAKLLVVGDTLKTLHDKCFSVDIQNVEIVKIVPRNKERDVYDVFGVEENNNFIANDIVVHNCDEAVRFACVDSKTNIKLPTGMVPIKSLENKTDFEVISFNEQTQQEEIQIAEKCLKIKEDIVFEIELVNGEKIRATKEHKFLTINGWKKLSELNNGDTIITT